MHSKAPTGRGGPRPRTPHQGKPQPISEAGSTPNTEPNAGLRLKTPRARPEPRSRVWLSADGAPQAP